MELGYSLQNVEKQLNIKFHDTLCSGSRVVPCGLRVWRTGGEAERRDRADRFANAPEDYKFSYSREISKYIMSTGKLKGTNLKISVTFKTS